MIKSLQIEQGNFVYKIFTYKGPQLPQISFIVITTE